MLGSILGPLISGGFGLLGSALQKQPNYKKIANETFKGEFNARMGAAEKYGISKLVMAGAPAPSSPGGVVGGGIGEGLAAMGQDIGRAVTNFASNYERQIAAETLKKARAENELINAQTRSINVRTAQQVAPPPPPGLIPSESMKPVTTTGGNIMNYPVPFAQGSSDAQVWQNRYGDFWEQIFGTANLIHDMYTNRAAIYDDVMKMGTAYWPTIQPYVAPWGVDYSDLNTGNYNPPASDYNAMGDYVGPQW